MKKLFGRMRLLSALMIITMLVTMLPASAASACRASDTGKHSWGSWDTVQAATCKEEGRRVRYCNNCGVSEWETVKKASHSYSSWKTTKEATCTHKGERTRKCSVCGHKSTTTIDMKAHSWGELTVITEPTAFSKGVSGRTCKVCGKTEQQDVYPEGTLKKGDKGNAVRDLQTKLNEKSFDCGKADGDFGKKTEAAVKSYEESKGIEADGIAWPGVIEMLNSDGQATVMKAPETSSGIKCTFEKSEASVPGNGQGYYEEGETVSYGFLVTSYLTTEDAMPVMYNIEIYDSMLNGDEPIEYFQGIMPGGEDGCFFDYTVTAADVERGYIENTAKLKWTESDSEALKLGVTHEISSNTVKVYTSPQEISDVFLDKHITSYPANDKYYVAGEEIVYSLSLWNTDADKVTDAEIVDYLSGTGEDPVVGYAKTVKKGESLKASFKYTVTELDVIKGRIDNTASAHWNEGGPVESNTVSAITGPKGDTYYFTFSDTAYVGQEYSHSFCIQDLDGKSNHVYGTLIEVDSELGYIGLLNKENFGNSSLCIEISGIPTQPGSSSCQYAILVDDDKWIIEVDMTAVYPEFIPEPDDMPVLLNKERTNSPADSNGYAEGEVIEYAVTVYNNSDMNIYGAVLSDTMLSEPVTVNVPINGSVILEYSYTVTGADVEQGYVDNTAELLYTSGDSEATKVYSETIRTYTHNTPGETVPHTVTLLKECINTPADPAGYAEGEYIQYRLTVSVSDNNYPDDWILFIDELAPELDKTLHLMYLPFEYSYCVTAEDAERGYVDNTAQMWYWDVDDNGENVQMIVTSNTVHTNTVKADNPVPAEPDYWVNITKAEESTPKNGKFYVKGETIHYSITYKNESDEMLDEIVIMDILQPGDHEIYVDVNVAPGEEKTIYFDYKVTKNDVESVSSYVCNVAYSLSTHLREQFYDFSNEVYSPVGKNPIRKPDPDPNVETPVMNGNCCVRTIVSRGNDNEKYTLHYCTKHYATETAVEAMVSSARTSGAKLTAWQYARTLWQADIAVMYDALMDAANGPAKLIVLNERALFEAQAATREAMLNAMYPDQPELVAKEIAELYMNRCVDMCYELHTAPGERKDDLKNVKVGADINAAGISCGSVILDTNKADVTYQDQLCPEHTTAAVMMNSMLGTKDDWQHAETLWLQELNTAWGELRTSGHKTVAAAANADESAFKSWLNARSELLTLLYPGKKDIVAQLTMKAVMNRVLEMCEGIG